MTLQQKGNEMQIKTLLKAFTDVNGASFIGVDSLTQVPLTGGKKNPMQGRVTKLMTGANVMVLSNQKTNAYAAMIERRLAAEGRDPQSFQLSARAWGTRIPDMPIVEHNGSYYLEVIFLRPGTVEYFLDGAPIAKQDIEGMKEATAGEQGGLSNKVIIRTFAAESITEVRVDSKVFK
jgi:hypothetical protein